MADARDLKSRGLKKPCGFESRHRHFARSREMASRRSPHGRRRAPISGQSTRRGLHHFAQHLSAIRPDGDRAGLGITTGPEKEASLTPERFSCSAAVCWIFLRRPLLFVACVFHLNTLAPHASAFARICGATVRRPTESFRLRRTMRRVGPAAWELYQPRLVARGTSRPVRRYPLRQQRWSGSAVAGELRAGCGWSCRRFHQRRAAECAPFLALIRIKAVGRAGIQSPPRPAKGLSV